MHMTRWTGIVVLLAILLVLPWKPSYGADWKFYGEFSRDKGGDELLFYDASDMIDSKNSIKLWIRTVPYSVIEQYLQDKKLVESVGRKLSSGYKAPITRVHPEAANAAYLEEAANLPAVSPRSEILYQISCSTRTMRQITGRTYYTDGTPDIYFGISKWENIAPGSNADDLAKLVCGQP
jgi:hypothetical protein